MTYADFTLEAIYQVLGLSVDVIDLFPELSPVVAPTWLAGALKQGRGLPLLNEKTRSELIVSPVLLASRELCNDAFTIYSGQRLDVDPEQGLVGECDFILTLTPPVPLLRAPLMTIVEAKKQDMEAGVGQCVAQMLGARTFNEKAGKPLPHIFGCVTTGENWQFLRLDSGTVSIDQVRYYIDNVGLILAVFQAIVSQSRVPPGTTPSHA